MSIQYTLLGFEPLPFRTITIRPGLPSKLLFFNIKKSLHTIRITSNLSTLAFDAKSARFDSSSCKSEITIETDAPKIRTPTKATFRKCRVLLRSGLRLFRRPESTFCLISSKTDPRVRFLHRPLRSRRSQEMKKITQIQGNYRPCISRKRPRSR